MGQYHILYNLDSGEYIDPSKIGLGLKQVEQALTVASIPDVLYMLLMASPARGSGDLDTSGETPDFKVFGRWVGQRAVVLGDYTEDEDISGVENASGLYGSRNYHPELDITDRIIPAFEVAFGIKIDMETPRGWRDRELDMDEWGWLFRNDDNS